MRKLLKFVSLLIASSFLLVFQTFALTLDTIGTSATTGGKPGTDWYYTSANPRLTGTAAASSSVTVTIDSVAYPVTASSTGGWTYTPTTLTTGDHTVTITGDGTSFSSTFHIGQTAPTGGTTTKGGTTASPSAQLPVTGAVENTLLLLAGGIAMVLAGVKLQKVLG